MITESNLEDIITNFNEKEKIFYQHINQFENDFADVVARYCNSDNLVIFVDDLDRCLPENAITVLESLKLYMGKANCIFILGIDHHVVEEGIRHRYGDRLKISGRDYLDKIIQIPFYLPLVAFISKTSEHTQAPDDDVVSLLLQATNLVMTKGSDS